MNRDIFLWIAIAGLVGIICILLWQRCSKKNPVEIDVGELFDRYYTIMLNLTRPLASEYSSGAYYDYDLIACLYYITIFYISILPKKNHQPMLDSLNHVLDERFRMYLNDRMKRKLDFYKKIFDGAPVRGDWCHFDIPKQTDIQLLVAFGDVLYNPSCADDYSGAPVNLRSVFESESFSEQMSAYFLVVQEYMGIFKREADTL